MSSPYQKPSIPRRVAQAVLVLVLIVISVLVWERARLHMSGAHRAALEQLQECEQARNLLGENIDSGWWGHHGYLHVPRRKQAWSATESSVDWWMPVAGSTGKGMLHFRGRKEGGFWKLDGFLEVDGTKVYTPKCEVLSSDSP
jgi:Cytochrome oxidase complex assembly protein 1